MAWPSWNLLYMYIWQCETCVCLQTLLMRGLARSKPAFKPTMLSAIVTLSLRPLLAASFSDNLLTALILHILSVPALIQHVTVMSEEVGHFAHSPPALVRMCYFEDTEQAALLLTQPIPDFMKNTYKGRKITVVFNLYSLSSIADHTITYHARAQWFLELGAYWRV